MRGETSLKARGQILLSARFQSPFCEGICICQSFRPCLQQLHADVSNHEELNNAGGPSNLIRRRLVRSGIAICRRLVVSGIPIHRRLVESGLHLNLLRLLLWHGASSVAARLAEAASNGNTATDAAAAAQENETAKPKQNGQNILLHNFIRVCHILGIGQYQSTLIKNRPPGSWP